MGIRGAHLTLNFKDEYEKTGNSLSPKDGVYEKKYNIKRYPIYGQF